MKKQLGCSGWCMPTILYIILAISGLVSILLGVDGIPVYNGSMPAYVLQYVFTQAIWILILYALCAGCKTNVAWFILFLPVIAVFVILFLLLIKMVSI